MKIISTSKSKSKKDDYVVEFSDGILLHVKFINGQLECYNMCSLGTDSFFMKRGSFPKGKNLSKRVELAQDTINARQRRYKKREISDESTEA
tara:strand:+ start:183 stop:458 length:276 start_codon:yes stop_codon:yes gene_type:complete